MKKYLTKGIQIWFANSYVTNRDPYLANVPPGTSSYKG